MHVCLTIIETQFYHFRHCVCRTTRCDRGDICQKNSDCGRDKWNRKGKCVTTKRPNRYGNFEFGGIKMSGSHYKKKHGNWRKHK